MLETRHIQMYGEANTTIKHYWGYPNRVLPCTSDKGTCEYLDAVYGMHETSMLYTFILWAVLGAVLILLFFIHHSTTLHRSVDIQTPLHRGINAIGAFGRRWLLPEAPGRWFFGRVTMLQVAVLLILSAYLLIFSYVGRYIKSRFTHLTTSDSLVLSTRPG